MVRLGRVFLVFLGFVRGFGIGFWGGVMRGSIFEERR